MFALPSEFSPGGGESFPVLPFFGLAGLGPVGAVFALFLSLWVMLLRVGAPVGCFRFAFSARPYARAIGSILTTILNRTKFRDFIRQRNKLATCVRRSLCGRRALGARLTGFPIPSARVSCAFTRTRSGS